MKKTIFAFIILGIPFLFGCDDTKVLEEWRGEYALLNFDGEKCTLSLDEEGNYRIKYLDNDYQGTYTSCRVDNTTGFQPRLEYYSNEDYPNEDICRSYSITLQNGDAFENLPDIFLKFFENNGESNQHLFVHTFKNNESFSKYGVTAKKYDVDPNKSYKEIIYYPNEMVLPTSDGSVIDYRKIDFYLMFQKVG